MIYKWWEELNFTNTKGIRNNLLRIFKRYTIRLKAYIENTYISPSAKLKGNIVIGKNCMIGDNVIIRGNIIIEDNVRIGANTEIKDSIIKENSTIGPLCYIGNSVLEQNVYLGAMVRTSNHRLDKQIVKSWNGEEYESTGMDKLGCWIKENSSLGVMCITYPGRIISENSTFEPRMNIDKNYGSGRYRIKQEIEKVEFNNK